MLACERWTLTHSSAWVVLVGLALALLLALLLGLAAMNASREAETVADGEAWDDEAWDDDGEAWDDDGEDDAADEEDELVWDGELVAEPDAADPEPEPEPDGEGDAGVLLGVLVGSVPDEAGAVGEADPEELEEPDGDGDGDVDVGVGVGDVDVGVGVGVGVAAAGSTLHVVSVFAAALVEALRLAEAARVFIVSARAAPGQPASTPRARDPPATRPSAAARTCARRMKTALSPLLFEVAACSLWGS